MENPSIWIKPANETCYITREQLKMMFITYAYATQIAKGQTYINDKLEFLTGFVNGLATTLDGRDSKNLTLETAYAQKLDLLDPVAAPNIIITANDIYKTFLNSNISTTDDPITRTE